MTLRTLPCAASLRLRPDGQVSRGAVRNLPQTPTISRRPQSQSTPISLPPNQWKTHTKIGSWGHGSPVWIGCAFGCGIAGFDSGELKRVKIVLYNQNNKSCQRRPE